MLSTGLRGWNFLSSTEWNEPWPKWLVQYSSSKGVIHKPSCLVVRCWFFFVWVQMCSCHSENCLLGFIDGEKKNVATKVTRKNICLWNIYINQQVCLILTCKMSKTTPAWCLYPVKSTMILNVFIYLYNSLPLLDRSFHLAAYSFKHVIIIVVFFLMSKTKLSLIEKYCNWTLMEGYFCELCVDIKPATEFSMAGKQQAPAPHALL